MGEIVAIWGCRAAHHQKYKQSMRDSISSFFTGFDLDRSRRSKPGKFASWLRTISLSLAHWTVRRSGTSLRSRAAATQLQSVLSTPVVRDGLRNYLAKRCGSENVDFLIGYWAFTKSVNALERFQQLSTLIHTFVREGCERPVVLTELSRRRLLREWDKWSEGNRVPAGTRLRGFEAAAAEIEKAVAASSTLTPARQIQAS